MNAATSMDKQPPAGSILPQPFLAPIYVSCDCTENLHLLTCNNDQQITNACHCREELKKNVHPDTPFLIIFIHKQKTYLMYMSKRLRACHSDCKFESCLWCAGIIIDINIEKGQCIRESCPCHLVFPSLYFLKNKFLGEDGVIEISRVDHFIHFPNCNENKYCSCIKTLIEQECIKFQIKISGHLSCDDPSDYDSKLLEHYTWPLLKPYNIEYVEKELHSLAEFVICVDEGDNSDFENSNDSEEEYENSQLGLSEKEIDLLPRVIIKQKHVDQGLDCTVCLGKFELHDNVKQLPCDHYFHANCILQWLLKKQSCPYCREVIFH